MGQARGLWRDGAVYVDESSAAQRLHKGSVGTLEGGLLRLDAVEAAWLGGKLEVDGHDTASLLAVSGRATDYIVYADLRSRGLLVHVAAGGGMVQPRGGEGAAYAYLVQSDTDFVDPTESLRWAAEATVLAVADEDGSVTYYRAQGEEVAGEIPQQNLRPFPGALLGERVLVTDPEGIRAAERESLGVKTESGIILSLAEARALHQRGVLNVEAPSSPTQSVYDHLRSVGALPKSGFKFGTHLRVYRTDPDDSHAEWLIHCCRPGDRIPWSDLARGIRVAHGVRKKFLLAVAGETVQYVRFTWFRP